MAAATAAHAHAHTRPRTAHDKASGRKLCPCPCRMLAPQGPRPPPGMPGSVHGAHGVHSWGTPRSSTAGALTVADEAAAAAVVVGAAPAGARARCGMAQDTRTRGGAHRGTGQTRMRFMLIKRARAACMTAAARVSVRVAAARRATPRHGTHAARRVLMRAPAFHSLLQTNLGFVAAGRGGGGGGGRDTARGLGLVGFGGEGATTRQPPSCHARQEGGGPDSTQCVRAMQARPLAAQRHSAGAAPNTRHAGSRRARQHSAAAGCGAAAHLKGSRGWSRRRGAALCLLEGSTGCWRCSSGFCCLQRTLQQQQQHTRAWQGGTGWGCEPRAVCRHSSVQHAPLLRTQRARQHCGCHAHCDVCVCAWCMHWLIMHTAVRMPQAHARAAGVDACMWEAATHACTSWWQHLHAHARRQQECCQCRSAQNANPNTQA
jgi:hypothetical protein